MKDYQENLDYIIDAFSIWKTKIHLSNKLGLYNLSTLSENIIRDLFNIIFEKDHYSLQNANLFTPNVDSIDLKDEINKVAVQVTTNNTYNKIKHTVNLFVENQHYLKYDKLLIVIIDERKGKRSNYKQNGYEFNIENVLYLDDIIKLIKDLPFDKISSIRFFLEKEYEKIKLDKREIELKEELRNKKYINQPIIDRKLRSITTENKLTFWENNEFSINDIISCNQKILILGDASCGKTIFLKDIVDKINETDFYFGIYKSINTFSNEEDLENYFLKNYILINKKRIILVLDGLDEIEERFRKDFIKKSKNFTDENNDITIILSCRSNIYNEIKILKEFKEYALCDFNKNDIIKYFKMCELDFNNIINDSKYREYGFLLHNPFYLNIICNHYKKTSKLLNRASIIDCAIDDIFVEDKEKYSITLDDIDSIQLSQKKLIQKLGFVLECLGRNYITDKELKEFAKKEYTYLTYCGLLRKEGNNWSFIHNNFGEYLASKELRKYNFKEITKIILDKKQIKFSWHNTLGFYLANNQDEKLIKLILENNPKLICNIEKDKFSNEKKLLFFKKIVEPYMNKKIWVTWDILHDNKFAEFFAIKDIYNYLCDVVQKNEYYVNTNNALEILISLVYYIKDDNLKDLLTKVLLSNKYNKYHKKQALHILANAKIGDKDFLLNIINQLKSEENQYLRAGYFYYINHMNLVDEFINDIFNYKTVVGRMVKAKWVSDENEDDEEPTLLDENMEYVELFKNIHNKKSVEIIISRLKESEAKREKFGKDILKNLCLSIKYLHISEEEKDELLIELYFIFLIQIKREEIVYLRNLLLSRNLRLSLFKKYLKNYEFRYRFDIMNIIDDKCIKYFYEEYEKGTYSDKIASDLLYDIPITSSYFSFIKNKYERNTSKKWEEPYRPLSEEQKNKLIQEYFDSLFDKKNYIKNINYIFEISEVDSINIKEIYRIRLNNDKHLWDDIIFDLTSHFLYRSKREEEFILNKTDIEKYINEFDWDYVIIQETLELLKHEKSIKISLEQLGVIENICLNKLSDLDYNNAIVKHKTGGYYIKGNIYITLSELRQKLNLHYPKKVLLDMLMYEPFQDYENKKLQSIIDEVGLEECQERILYNLRNLDLIDFILESYLDFCIKYELFDDVSVVYDYFNSSDTSPFTKIHCLKYIVKSNNKKALKQILNNINDFDEATITQIVEHLANEEMVPVKYLSPLYHKINNEEAKKIICGLEIKNNISRGYKEYYKYLKINKKTYGMDFNSKVSNVNKLYLTHICFRMLKLTYSKDFKDSVFDSLYSNLTKGIVNIGRKNKINKSIVILFTKMFMSINKNLKNINFLQYILEDLKPKNTSLQSNNMTIEDIKKILK